jgi:hypothetical protein
MISMALSYAQLVKRGSKATSTDWPNADQRRQRLPERKPPSCGVSQPCYSLLEK